MRLVVVGAGQLGSALAVDAVRAGHVVTVAARRPLQSDLQARGCAVVVGWPIGPFDVAVVCVPDRAVLDAARQAVRAGVQAAVWLHTAGALAGDHLRAAVPALCAVGNLHPLAAVAGPADPSPLRGALFALAGDPAAVAVARQLAASMGGAPTAVPDAARPAYHAAAALVANDWVALFSLAEAQVASAGLDPAALRRGLLHLGRSALDRVAQLGADEPAIAGLTGAVRRGDAATVQVHLAALQSVEGAAALHADASAVLVNQLVASGRLSGELAAAVRAICAAHRSNG